MPVTVRFFRLQPWTGSARWLLRPAITGVSAGRSSPTVPRRIHLHDPSA
jgi:hypothetical protein